MRATLVFNELMQGWHNLRRTAYDFEFTLSLIISFNLLFLLFKVSSPFIQIICVKIVKYMARGCRYGNLSISNASYSSYTYLGLACWNLWQSLGPKKINIIRNQSFAEFWVNISKILLEKVSYCCSWKGILKRPGEQVIFWNIA